MALFAPPPDLTVSQWADKVRQLSSEASAEPGAWRNSRTPYLVEIMDTYVDPQVRETWCMKSAQVGWTEALNNLLGYVMHQTPGPVLMIQPTLQMAEAWSKDRLSPMLRDTPQLSDLVESKARAGDNTILHKTFPGGHLTAAGANSPASLASRPIRDAFLDEVDRYPRSAGTEGDPISLVKKRQVSFWNKKTMAGSTPTIKGASRIEAGFDGSDQRFYMVPCPHCTKAGNDGPDGFQRLLWPNVRWDDGAPEEARYACVHCGALIDHREKQWMLEHGRWQATKHFTGVAGFHLSELYSPFVTWGEMAVSFLVAKKLPETLQTFINTSLGETWELQGDVIEAEGLLSRREAYTAATAPAGVLAVTLGVDVQDDRLELQFVGWGADEECWPIDYVVIRGNPAQAEVYLELDEQIARVFHLEDGRSLPVEATAVDSGGHCTQQVYRYCVKRKARRVWAIKGAGGAGRLVWPRTASRAARSRAPVFIVGVDSAKEILYGRLAKVDKPGPGFIHMPSWATEEYLEQLTSEKRVIATIQGHKVVRWQLRASNARQEAQDTWIYAYAALQGRADGRATDLLARRKLGQEKANGPQPAAEPELEMRPAEAVKREIKRQLRAPRRKGFANNW